MRTLESLAVSRRGGSSLSGLPFSLTAHAAVAAAVVLLPLLWPPELPATPGGPTERVTWAMPTPPPIVRVQQPERRRPLRLAQDRSRAGGGGWVTVAPTFVPDGLPEAGDDPGQLPGRMQLGGSDCADCGSGDPSLPPGAGLPVGDSGPSTVVVSGRDVTPPRKLRNVSPVYPDLAQRSGVQAQVVIECTIDPQGRIAQARVLSGHPLFDAPALEAVRQWVYTPTLVGGVPVSVLLTVTVTFHFQR
jgi:protein TonB